MGQIIKNSFREYCEIDAYNQSMMQKLIINPRRLTVDDDKTGALSLGVAFHAFILEPDSFLEEYVMIDGDKRTKAYKDAAKAFHENSIISGKEAKLMEAMKEGLERQPKAVELLEGVEEVEGTVLWDDEQYGIPCKARLDGLSRSGKYIADLKTTRNAWEFSSKAKFYGYDFQAAFYVDGLKACGVDVNEFYFIVCEKEQSNDCIVYKAGEEFINRGRQKYRKAFDIIMNMDRTGYPETVLTLD
jgi:hypothetical protein